jgi:hypothetical protein
MKENRLTRFGFFPPASRFFGGGGRTQQQQAVVPSAPAAPVVAPPAAPAIVNQPAPAVAPPATATSAEVLAAQQDKRREALKRKGFSKTVFAGDSGGWNPSKQSAPTGPANTKLG